MSIDSSTSLSKCFGFGFTHRIVPHGAAVGVFDAQCREQCIVGTETQKLILQGAESVFHVNEPITCLAVYHRRGEAHSASEVFDVVLVGTRTSLMAFDVFNNKTVFHREMPEGVNCLKVGLLDEHREDIIICGCGTTIWGFALNGTDLFWTALGDVVNALELCDMDGDGQNELIVGTDGTEIKVFKHTSFWNEFDEGDPALALCALRTATFAFGLASGVVGVYGNGERLWRVKTKAQIIALLPFPDAEHVACIWNNGKVDIRGAQNGEIRCKDQLDGEVVAAMLADLNAVGSPQLTLSFRNGQVLGLESRRQVDQCQADESAQIREFSQRKHNLLEELRNYEQRDSGTEELERSMIPAGTVLSCVLDLNADRELCLHLSLSNAVPIRTVLLFAEGIFASECHTIHPNGKESSDLTVHFLPAKNVLSELFIKVFGGYTIERQLQVFEVNQVLPRFVTFVHVDESVGGLPESFVEFHLRTRPDQLRIWLNENFAFLDIERLDRATAEQSGLFQLRFLCIRNAEPLHLDIRPSGECKLYHNDIQNAGDFVQSIAAYLGVKVLESRAHFPRLLASINDMISALEERYDVSDRLASELAERLSLVRECVVRAEDALAIRNFSDARKLYTRSAMLNRELVTQKTIRANARMGLLGSLKQLNLSIEQFSRLRVGEPSTQLIHECRKAIAGDNLGVLTKLLEFGV